MFTLLHDTNLLELLSLDLFFFVSLELLAKFDVAIIQPDTHLMYLIIYGFDDQKVLSFAIKMQKTLEFIDLTLFLQRLIAHIWAIRKLII